MITAEQLEQFRLTEVAVRMAAALRLHQDEKLTLSLAAKFAGLDRIEFMREMTAHGIPMHYTEEDLANDLAYAGYDLKA
jgi:predicted HTH domain antitoxin